MSADALGIVTAGWAIVMALAPVLQIRRILDRLSANDVSVGCPKVQECPSTGAAIG